MEAIAESIKARDRSQNYFKALLVIGMVFAHAIQLLTNVGGLAKYFSIYINLITFSGFMFSFGYIYQAAYSTKKLSFWFAIGKMKTTLFAYLISAIFWAIFIDHDVSANRIGSIVSLINPSPYSEFLLAFFIMTGVYFSFRPVLEKVTSTANYTAITCISLLILSFIPFGDYPYVGLFLGSVHGSYFPILHYLIFFVLGLWFKKRDIAFSWKVLAGSMAGLVLLCAYRIILHELPARFPPSPFWIVGSFFFIYAYFLLSKKIKSNRFSGYLNQIGENTIVYLVLSNIFLFALSTTGKYTIPTACVLACGIMLTIGYLVSSSRSFKS